MNDEPLTPAGDHPSTTGEQIVELHIFPERWRVFIGAWDEHGDHDWINFDSRFTDWRPARNCMEMRLQPFLNDECETCREDGREALDKLSRLEPDQPFEASIDGDDYLLMKL